MPLYDVYAGITYNHTVIADDEDRALEDGEGEAKERLVRYFGLVGYDRDDLTVFDSVLDLEDDAPEGGHLYVLTAALAFCFPVEAADAAMAEEAAAAGVALRAGTLGVQGLSREDISVWSIMGQGNKR